MNYAQKLLWNHVYDIGLPTRVPRVGPGFLLTIPPAPGRLNYVWTQSGLDLYPPGKRQAGHRMIVTATVTMTPGAEVIGADPGDEGTGPPAMRMMLCRNMYGANNRWFSLQGMPMTPGTHTLSVSLDPANWGQVTGQVGNGSNALRKAFDSVCESSIRLCLTFGEGSDYGHGLAMAAADVRCRWPAMCTGGEP